MKYKGDDIFLEGAKGGIASGLRKEFKDTDEGNKITDRFFVAFDGSSTDNYNITIPRYGKYTVKI